MLQQSWKKVYPRTRVLYRINKDEGNESLHFLVFWRHIVNAVFLKYSKEGSLSLSSSHAGIRNIPSDICPGVTKHYHITMCRRTQNPFKHLRWNVFAQTVYTLKSLTEYVKKPHLTRLKGFEYASAAKQGRCKVCEKTFWRRYVKYINLRDVCFEIFQWYYLAFDCATKGLKIYELALFNNIFVQLF